LAKNVNDNTPGSSEAGAGFGKLENGNGKSLLNVNNSMPHPVFSTFCKRFDTAYWPKMPMTTPTNFN
jgi:hypothetical protein